MRGRRNRRLTSWMLAALLGFNLSFSLSPALSADPKKAANWAATELDQVDDDFAYQGEYVGTIAGLGTSGVSSVGLQIVALGDAEFQAVLLPGGLPGAGWNQKERLALTGTRGANGVLSLGGAGYAAAVTGETAAISSSKGELLGSLRKTIRRSPTEGLARPADGVPLFQGTWSKGFRNPKRTKDGLLMVGTETVYPFRDFKMHVEFRLPYMPYARGQGRANSGVYLQSRYEVQILDSFGLEGKNNECGSLYTYKAPDVNMCYPPLSWQTYEIEYRAPRFDPLGNKYRNGELTVWQNGVKVQDHFAFERKTGAGQPEGPSMLPTKLQDHGNPVHFRNIWIVGPNTPPVPYLEDHPSVTTHYGWALPVGSYSNGGSGPFPSW